MNLVDLLVAERVSSTSLLHQVTVTAGADFILCLEGWDDSVYYAHHIRQRRGAMKVEMIRCGKKGSVLWLMEALSQRGYRNGRILFFVDRDLDEFVAPVAYDSPCLFVTDKYSFENYLVGEQCFDLVWSDIFGLPLRGSLYDDWRAKYAYFMSRHASLLNLAAAVAVIARRNGAKVYLNEVETGRRVVATPDGGVRLGGRVASALGKSLRAAAEGRWREIRKLTAELDADADATFARGKNLFAASVDFFAIMRNNFLAPGSGVVCRKVPHFTAAHLLDSLSARMQCPARLGEFVDAA